MLHTENCSVVRFQAFRGFCFHSYQENLVGSVDTRRLKKGVNWVMIPVVSIHKSQFIYVPIVNKGSVDGKVRLQSKSRQETVRNTRN